MLEDCWKMDPLWTQKTIEFIKDNTNMTQTQVYKWGYDQKRNGACKEGIRYCIRETKRVKLSDSSLSDYNMMVNELFPEVESELTQEPAGLDDMLNGLKQSIGVQKAQNSFHTVVQSDQTSNESDTSNFANIIRSYNEYKIDVQERDVSMPLSMNTTYSDFKVDYKDNTSYDQGDVMSNFGDISDDHDRQLDFDAYL
jgi:hypothetical protein